MVILKMPDGAMWRYNSTIYWPFREAILELSSDNEMRRRVFESGELYNMVDLGTLPHDLQRNLLRDIINVCTDLSENKAAESIQQIGASDSSKRRTAYRELSTFAMRNLNSSEEARHRTGLPGT